MKSNSNQKENIHRQTLHPHEVSLAKSPCRPLSKTLMEVGIALISISMNLRKISARTTKENILFRKNKTLKTVLALLISIGMFWAGMAGCKSKTPLDMGFPLPYPTPSLSSDYLMVCDFESTTPTAVNSGLYDPHNPPSYTLVDPGSFLATGADNVSIGFAGAITGGALGTATAYESIGAITDYGNGQYPSFSLQAWFKYSHAPYDLSAFSGIQYYLNVESDDTAPWRAFQIPLSSTWPVTYGGACVNDCYDHFYANYGSTSGAWVRMSHSFSDLKRRNFGAPLNPPNLAGENLRQALFLQWDEGNQNNPGSVIFHFSVDEIEFY
jgi:hypothetical protein